MTRTAPGGRGKSSSSVGHRRTFLIAATAAVVSAAAAVAYVLLGTDHSESATTGGAAASAIPTVPQATSIFDRGGSAGGVLLGRLNLRGVRDADMRAPLFLDNQVEPRLVRMCMAGLLPSPPPGQDCVDLVHTAGYQVTTTLDWQATEQALHLLRDAIAAGRQSGCDCHDGAIVTIEPQTGELIVYVPNTNSGDAADLRAPLDIDQIVEANAPGSAFMPITFLAWFDRLAKAPMSTLWDTNPLELPDGGTIANPRADGGSEGLISARAALAAMQDVPAYRAADEVGIDAVLDVAAKLGITTLAQKFDPTWSNHPNVNYGPNMGAAGVNISAIDMAYADATIANLGMMVGAPSLAATLDASDLPSISLARDQDYDKAVRQRLLFQRGDIRLSGTRALDPIVVLEVLDRDGNVLFSQREPERRQVINPGSVWLLHTIMSDCTARYIIWGCGKANADLALDFALADGRIAPSGVQFGRMAFPPDPTKVLESWMTGYSRHAATVVWIGNSNNAAVNDRAFASSNTAVRLWKAWMASYHDNLLARGKLANILAFDELKPPNVAFGLFRSPTTDRDHRPAAATGSAALCEQVVEGWFRTDVQYAGECESVEVDTRDSSRASSATPTEFKAAREFPALPELLPDSALSLARALGIPTAPTPPAGN